MKKYAKFIVATAGVVVIVAQVIASADLSTSQGLISAAIALVTALGVYQVPNKA